jgi:tetratricopeptide (TPR) repeat protein
MNRLIFYLFPAIILLAITGGTARAETDYMAACRDDGGTARWRIENCTFVYGDQSRPDAERGLAVARRAVGLLELHQSEAAGRDVARARRLAPDDPEVTRIYAMIEGDATGDPERAIAALNELIGKGEADPVLLYERAMAYYRRRDFERALADIDQVIGIDADNAEYHRQRGLILTALMRNEESVAATTEAMRLDPNDTFLHHERAGPAFVSGQFELARDDLNIALKQDFQQSPFWRMRGGAAYALGDFEAATRDFVHDIKLEPVGSSLQAWRFLAQFRAGKATKADASALARQSPDNWPSALLALMGGDGTLAAAEAQAGAVPQLAETRQSQILFFLGEWELLNGGSTSVARGHFEKLVAGGVKGSFAKMTANGQMVTVNEYNILEFGLASARLKGRMP